MTLLALALYLAGLAAAFGWRSIAQRRRTGDTGLRLHAGPVGSVAWWAKLAFVVALLLGLAGPAAGLGGLAPVPAAEHNPVRLVGLVLAVTAVAATLTAQRHMGASWRVGVDPCERTALVTSGAFTLVRNPVFTAMALTSVGLALMVPNVVSLAATAVLLTSIQPQVRAVEEPHLARLHTTAHTTYTAQVGRFIPRLRTRPRSHQNRGQATGPDATETGPP